MIRRDADGIGVVIHGLASHAFSLAAAIRVLDEAGEHAQAVPLVRQLVECAVTAMWVEEFGRRAAVTIMREDARNRLETFRRYEGDGIADDGSIEVWSAALVTLSELSGRESEKFHQRCDELQDMSRAYNVYRALSALSHAGGAVVDLYSSRVETSDAAPLGMTISATARPWPHGDVLGIALSQLLYAGMAWDRMVKGRPRRTRLKEIAAELGLTLTWSASATGLTRQRTWEKEQKARRAAGASAGPSGGRA